MSWRLPSSVRRSAPFDGSLSRSWQVTVLCFLVQPFAIIGVLAHPHVGAKAQERPAEPVRAGRQLARRADNVADAAPDKSSAIRSCGWPVETTSMRAPRTGTPADRRLRLDAVGAGVPD